MSEREPEELDAIRDQKRKRLLNQTTDRTEDPAPDSSPTTPIQVKGESHLHDLIADHETVLIDYHAEWCGPCQMLAPVLERLADETGVVVAKVDIDHHQDLAGQANVRGVPTLLLYSDGEQVERLVGMRDEGTLRRVLDQYDG